MRTSLLTILVGSTLLIAGPRSMAAVAAASPAPPLAPVSVPASVPAQAGQQAVSPAEATAAEAVAAIQAGTEKRNAPQIKEALLKLDPIWKDISPKTLDKVVKAVAAMFSKFKPQIEQDIDQHARDPKVAHSMDEPDKYAEDSREPVLDCYRTAVGLLHDKPQGPATLLPVLKLPHVKAWPDVQALILQGLGFREDPALMKEFETYLSDPSAAVAAQAARALGRYADQPMDVRRAAVSALIGALELSEKMVSREKTKVREGDPTPYADYQANIFVGFHESLTALTRQNLEKTAEWRAWFDAHGKDAEW